MARDLADRLVDRPRATVVEQIRSVIRSVEYRRDRLVVTFSGGGLGAALGLAQSSAEPTWPSNESANAADFSITVPLQTKRRGPQMKLVVTGTGQSTELDPSLVTAVVRAWDWADRLISGEVATMAEICAEEGLSDSYVGRLLPLAFLAPSMVEDILTGRQPATLTANDLAWGGDLPMVWDEQVQRFGDR